MEDIIIHRQTNIISRHPRLSGIGRQNRRKTKKDSGQAGMTKLQYSIAELIIYHDLKLRRLKKKDAAQAAPFSETSSLAAVILAERA